MPKIKDVNVPRLAMSRTDLAISLGVSGDSVDLMVAEGFLPPPRQWHKRNMWIVQEVQAALFDWPISEAPKPVEEDWTMTA